jgi:hypothetical protein
MKVLYRRKRRDMMHFSVRTYYNTFMFIGLRIIIGKHVLYVGDTGPILDTVPR